MSNTPMSPVASTSSCNLGNLLAEKYGPIAEPQPREPYQFSVELGAFRFDGPEDTDEAQALRGFIAGAVDEVIARSGGRALFLAVMAANADGHDLELLNGVAETAKEHGITLSVETLSSDLNLSGLTFRADDPELEKALSSEYEVTTIYEVTLAAQGEDGDAELTVHTDHEGVAWGYSFWFLASNGQEIQVRADTLEGLKARLLAAARDLRKAA